MKVYVFTSTVFVLAYADTSTDCTAVASTIAASLMIEESIAAQQAILLFPMYLVAILVAHVSNQVLSCPKVSGKLSLTYLAVTQAY